MKIQNYFAILAASVLSACAGSESIQRVSIMPNSSGLEAGEFTFQGAHNFFGSGPPNVPSSVSTTLRRIHPLNNDRSGYLTTASGSVRILSIERPEDLGLGFGSVIQKWRLLMDQPDSSETVAQTMLKGQLSEIPWKNEGRAFHAKLRHRTFPWGKAVMFLTTYVQGNTGAPLNNDMLVLVVQGLTDDERYAVSAHFEISHPKLPVHPKEPANNEHVFIPLDEDSDGVEKWLNAQPDNAFYPTFIQYETFLTALKIEAR